MAGCSGTSPLARPSSGRGEGALAVLLAGVACLPALLPGAEAYVDNGPHLAEVWALAWQILPEDRWYTGWSDVASAGLAVGQLNAPLVWVGLAGLVRMGVPAAPAYLLAIPVSNAVFAWGAWRLGRRLFRRPEAAALGAVLAALSVSDLYGIGGAAGGMWPHRLGNGLLLLWLARTGRGDPRWHRGAGLAVILLVHTYSGVLAFGWLGLQGAVAAVRARGRELAGHLGVIGWGLALTAFFWVPLLSPGSRTFEPPPPWGPVRQLAALLLPVDVYDLQVFQRISWIGGGLGLGVAGATVAGLLLALLRRPGWRDWGLGVRVGGLVAIIVLVVGVWVPLTGWEGAGPNPWRHYALARGLLALVAGAGWVALPWGRRAWWVLAVAAAATVLATGLREIPHGLFSPAGSPLEPLRATGERAAAAAGGGRIYHQDPFRDPRAPAALRNTHPGPLLTLRNGQATLGSWYGITPQPTHPWTTSEAIFVMGGEQDFVAGNPDWLYGRFRLYGVTAVVGTDPWLAALLAGDPRYRPLGGEGPFRAFALEEPPLPLLGVPPEEGRVAELSVRRDRVRARLAAPEGGGRGGEIPFRLRYSWHPGWRATLNGQKVPLEAEETSGLVTGVAPGPGTLVLAWSAGGGAERGLSALAWLCLMGAAVVSRARGAARGR